MVSGEALDLYVNSIQAEDVLPDDTVNPAVTGTAPVLSRTGPPAIAHRREQVEHELFQEDRLLVEYALQDSGRQCLVAFPTAATVAPTPPTSLALPHCWWPNCHKCGFAPRLFFVGGEERR